MCNYLRASVSVMTKGAELQISIAVSSALFNFKCEAHVVYQMAGRI